MTSPHACRSMQLPSRTDNQDTASNCTSQLTEHRPHCRALTHNEECIAAAGSTRRWAAPMPLPTSCIYNSDMPRARATGQLHTAALPAAAARCGPKPSARAAASAAAARLLTPGGASTAPCGPAYAAYCTCKGRRPTTRLLDMNLTRAVHVEAIGPRWPSIGVSTGRMRASQQQVPGTSWLGVLQAQVGLHEGPWHSLQ
jgi:hypothetical protein